MRAALRALFRLVVSTDSTFERVELRGARAWEGQCLHCKRRLLVKEDGEPLGKATLEHIVPRSQGGDDAAGNLALACERCNHHKGRTHDKRGLKDARAAEVIEALLARRRLRWRDPDE